MAAVTNVSEETTSESLRVGWIGTGVMGASMCGHILKAGHRVTVNSRTRAKAAALEQAGAVWAGTPGDAARGADVVLTMVGHPADVRSVYFDDDGVLASADTGTLLVDMTTTEPTLARRIHAAARERGMGALDAPVSGGDVGARAARLSIMVGGDPDDVARATPLLRLLGTNIVHQGPAGAGQHAKMCNQIVVAGTMIGVCESLVYARAAGLDCARLLESIAGGAAACWTLDNLAPRALRGDFAPGFMIDHFVKDMGIALAEARRMSIALPGLALVEQLYVAATALGHGRSGTHALLLALEHVSGRGGPVPPPGR